MASTTAAGTGLAISAGIPATNNEAGIKALTYTEVDGVETIGTFGTTFEKVNFQPLKGVLRKFKGSRNSGGIQPKVAHDDADAGQSILRTAGADESQKLYYAEVTYPDGAKRYFGGRVFGDPEDVGAANTIITATYDFEISTPIYKTAAGG